MSSLAVWVLRAMFLLLGTWGTRAQANVGRLRELVIIAIIMADASEATPLPGHTPLQTAALLTEIGALESGFTIDAVGRGGEIGPWQLMPPAPKRLRDQAAEAIRRWRDLGPNGYTGELGGRCPFTICPCALNRELGGALLAEGVP